ncbi:Zn-dependent protease with chaperone function [Hydrogenophaga palleronii]|uniref:Zn-dependent protease with chaperone function n=1 Tax=Hydrogenophaga palleronii TaxID=65655 RepID=A0ABU1WKA2_9BURK|nr:M48 family metallopeptidase [Hydrogenophaga palleronii]MDR7149712.1 Zn-dependent protease with chaperone function [Hydrogenophaga palleronii]
MLLWPGQVLARDACLNDPKRAHELRVLDEAQVIDMMDSFQVIALPQRLHRMLDSLVAASPRLRDGPAIHLLAFDDAELNAYAADHGLVILTSALWSEKENLSDDELAAVIAHELAHIEKRDSLIEACANLNRLQQPDLSFEEARDRMALEMFNPYSHIAREARRELHDQEHHADLRGIELLRRVGRNPHAMVSVLAKLHGNGTPSLNLLMGSTHPDVRERLQRAQAAANAGTKPPRAARSQSR